MEDPTGPDQTRPPEVSDRQSIAIDALIGGATHREAAEKASEAARCLNEQVTLSRHLPAGLQVIGVRVDTFLSQFDEAIPDLPALPASFVVAPSSGRVSGRRRLLHALSRRP